MPDVLDRLGEQLEEIQIPSSADRRQAALIVAMREVVERQQSSSSPRALRGLRAALAAGLLIVVVVAFTPPGRAAAEWIAERVGIGEPGGEPSLKEFREFTTEGTIAEGRRATVVARGPTPHGGHYELLTFKEKRYGSRCYELNIADAQGRPFSSSGGSCERAGAPAQGAGAAAQPLPASGGLRIDSTGTSILPDRELQSVVGRVSADVESVEVSFNGPLETQLIPVDEALAEELGIEHPFQVFAAFATEARHGGMIEIIARDETGNEVAHFRRRQFDLVADNDFICQMERERAARPGGRTPEQADRFCQNLFP